jgi:hypothetical protein
MNPLSKLCAASCDRRTHFLRTGDELRLNAAFSARSGKCVGGDLQSTGIGIRALQFRLAHARQR